MSKKKTKVILICPICYKRKTKNLETIPDNPMVMCNKCDQLWRDAMEEV